MLLRLIWCTKSDWTDDDELGTDISTNICTRKMVQPQEKNFLLQPFNTVNPVFNVICHKYETLSFNSFQSTKLSLLSK